MNSRLDPEDVVQSVFRTFFTRLKNDQFEIADDDDLSKLLVRITLHKTLRQIAYHRAARRDPGHEAPQGELSQHDIMQVMAKEPTPVTVVTFIDQLDHFLGRLSPEEQQILTLRLQGFSTDEIASADPLVRPQSPPGAGAGQGPGPERGAGPGGVGRVGCKKAFGTRDSGRRFVRFSPAVRIINWGRAQRPALEPPECCAPCPPPYFS